MMSNVTEEESAHAHEKPGKTLNSVNRANPLGTLLGPSTWLIHPGPAPSQNSLCSVHVHSCITSSSAHAISALLVMEAGERRTIHLAAQWCSHTLPVIGSDVDCLF